MGSNSVTHKQQTRTACQKMSYWALHSDGIIVLQLFFKNKMQENRLDLSGTG
jgi:hypothetical protein